VRIAFSYPDVAPLEVPERNPLAVLEPKAAEPPRALGELVEDALNNPIGSPRLEELVSPSTRILILVDDITRQTPAWGVLPSVMGRLHERGVAKGSIRILIASGTHTPMTAAEIEKKLGPEIPRAYEVALHYWKTREALVEMGATADGTPVRINRMVREADLAIGIGQIVPHRVMGFTGGGTIVQPGVCGAEVTGYTHWASAQYPGSAIMGIAENPVRQEVEQIAQRAGLRFIVNVVMDGQQRVVHVVAGAVVAAHRVGARLAREIYGVRQDHAADIVVSESYPADYDLWQAAKGIYSAELAVRPGGVVVLVTPCPHGVSDEHPEVEKFGYRGLAEVKDMVAQGRIADLVAAAHLVHVGRVIRDKARGIMVSPGIDPEVQRRIGFESAATPQEALERALRLVGADARIVVLRHGGDVLPLLTQ